MSPAAPAAKRKTARDRLAEKRLQLRKEARASVSQDEIVCQLCHQVYRAIRVSHLRAAHDYQGEHPVEDYKAKFGLRVAASVEVCRTLCDLRTERARREGVHYTRKQVLWELRRRLRAGRSISPSGLGEGFYQTVCRRFGTWTRAVRHLGIDPLEHRRTRCWPRARILRGLRERGDRGAALSMSSVSNEHPALYMAARRSFGSWAGALRAAGFDPRTCRKPAEWDLARAEVWIRELHARGGSLKPAEVPRPIYASVCRRSEGGWGRFVRSLGLPYGGLIRHMDWTAAEVTAEISRRRRAGLPLNLGAVQAEGQSLTHQARSRFGSWDAALSAAGVDPGTTRLQRPAWTRKEIITALRRRQREGRSLRFATLKRDEPRLLKAALKLFPFSLARALNAAGLDPACAGGRARSARGSNASTRSTGQRTRPAEAPR